MMTKVNVKKIVASTCVLALGMNGFSETVAYWQLQDQSAGTAAPRGLVLRNEIKPSALEAKVSTGGNGKASFSADVPGRVIVAGKDAKVVNANNTASSSVGFTVAGNPLLAKDTFTVEAFVKIEQLPKWGRVIYKNRQNGLYSWLLQQSGESGILRARIDSNATGTTSGKGFNDCRNSKFKAVDNQWHHLAVTYDGATQMFVLYADYRVLFEYKPAFPMVFDDSPLAVFSQGKGSVDEVRISNVVLGPDDFLKVR
jgi:hypothetical protein